MGFRLMFSEEFLCWRCCVASQTLQKTPCQTVLLQIAVMSTVGKSLLWAQRGIEQIVAIMAVVGVVAIVVVVQVVRAVAMVGVLAGVAVAMVGVGAMVRVVTIVEVEGAPDIVGVEAVATEVSFLGDL